MYFSTYSVYDEQDNVYKHTENECLICLNTKDNEILIEFKELYKNYDCNCNGFYHKSCLLEWFKKSFSCPICRKSIINEYSYLSNCLFNTCKFVTTYCFQYGLIFVSIHLFLLITYDITNKIINKLNSTP